MSNCKAPLMNKFMVTKLKLWEMEGSNGEKMSGNWICAVSPKSKGVDESPAPAPSAAVDDDEIPF
jgi:hypothetical protein